MLESTSFLLRSLVEDGQITRAEQARAEAHARANDTDVAQALVELQILPERALAIARAKICEYPYVDLAAFDVNIRNALRLPKRLAERVVAFPLFVIDGVATVAMEDPLNLDAIDHVHQHLKVQVDPVLADGGQLRALIAKAYSLVQAEDAGAERDDDEDLTTGDEPIVAAVNHIIGSAIESGASDVHINPDEQQLHLRYRVDGVLIQQQGPTMAFHAGIVQRLKVMSKLDLTQTRRPQDGKFRFVHDDQPVDVRVSIIPTVHGENVVLRLLRPAAAIGTIGDLGMPTDVAGRFEELIARPHGILLVTGPTGCGKTTTLYTALARLNRPDRNIVTIEDPVEIRLPLVRQVQVNAEIGMTFAGALRSILRQDPDVILVGEIRDDETARIAVQSALTGHLVFSTLHTNDAVGSVARLRDFGVPSFAINNALLCAIAQRLVRKVCEHCASEVKPESSILAAVGAGPGGRYVAGRGCPRCASTGYRGRVGVYEMLRMTASMQQLVEQDAPSSALRAQALKDGMRPMVRDGIEKAQIGVTTLDEVRKIVASVDDELADDLRLSA